MHQMRPFIAIAIGVLILLAFSLIQGCSALNSAGRRTVTLPPSKERRIVEARFDANGTLELVTTEKQGDSSLLRLIRCDQGGAVQNVRSLALEDGCWKVRAFPMAGSMTVGWLDRHGNLWLCRDSGDELVPRLALEDPGAPAWTSVDWWLLEVRGSLSIFVLRGEPIPNPKSFSDVEGEVRVLSWYTFQNGLPEMLAKIKVAREPHDCAWHECGGGEKGAFVWQTVGAPGPPLSLSPGQVNPRVDVRTVRFAKLGASDSPKWQEVYMGNGPLRLLVEATCGSLALIGEWKNPQDGAGIYTLIDAESGRLFPVAADGGFSSTVRLCVAKKRGGTLTVVVAVKNPSQDINVTRLDETYRIVDIAKVNAKGAIDYQVAGRGDEIYVVLLLEDGIKTVRLPEVVQVRREKAR